jgi:sulfotransferase family protein
MRQVQTMRYAESATAMCLESEDSFNDLETYCMFIGYPRSGHSLIGALLDAHPNVIIAHELNVLKRIREGLNERQIYQLLLENSRTKAQAGRGASGYSYEVPNQWQGKFQKLKVIGDKQRGGSSRRLGNRPGSLQNLRSTLTCKIKFIHVTRNPYDNIATIADRKNWSLEESATHYFSLCENNQKIKAQIAARDLFDLQHESFIAKPQVILEELCQFLSVDACEDYLNDCASIVYKSPHRSRNDARWDGKLIDAVKNRIAEFRFLAGYSFES